MHLRRWSYRALTENRKRLKLRKLRGQIQRVMIYAIHWILAVKMEKQRREHRGFSIDLFFGGLACYQRSI